MTRTSAPPERKSPIAPGKVPAHMLSRLLDIPRFSSPRVVVGPRLGEDAAVVDLESGMVAVATDPITFPTPRPGYYAVHVNANDIAVMGAEPEYFTLTMIMPAGTAYGEFESIMRDAIEAADSLPAVLIGGHSEVSEVVSSPVIAVTMIGRLATRKPLCTGGGRSGDAVIQVGPMAVEGTSILASTYRDKLAKNLGADRLEKAAGFLYDPGLSIVPPARLAARNLDVSAMHDPTEGGLATGLLEIAQASKTGLSIHKDRLLVAGETRDICDALDLDPMGVISSGCLLFTVPPGEADKAVKLLADHGFTASEIGRLTDREGEYELIGPDRVSSALPRFDVDELARE